jgi:hypothetical protein
MVRFAIITAFFSKACCATALYIEAEIALLDTRLDELQKEHVELGEALSRWITVPGVDRVAA